MTNMSNREALPHFGSRYEKVAVVCNDGSKADVRVRLVPERQE